MIYIEKAAVPNSGSAAFSCIGLREMLLPNEGDHGSSYTLVTTQLPFCKAR